MTKRSYGKLVAGLIAAWFLSVLLASALHAFQNDSNRLGFAVAVAALSPIILFLLWFATSAGFRQFVLELNPRSLTMVQAWRIGGFVFLVLNTYGILPGIFALPAGWGDIAVGATAPIIATKLANRDHRSGFILWQIAGMADLVMAVTLGTTARLISPHSTAMLPMTVLPLSLIPTFAVPLLLVFHIICIAQARRWHEREAGAWDDHVSSSAA